MLDKIADNPNLTKYLVSFHKGQTIFLEGDQSQAMYVLVSGQLDVLKGEQVISSVVQPGAIFGEMSFLLGSARTATLRARSDAKAIRIPKDKISDFLNDFPEASQEMTRLLALRLDRTSRVLFGLKELCDQLPDAMVMSDADGNIQAWNRAASNLYGKDWSQVAYTPAEEAFQDPQAFHDLVARARAGNRVVEEPLSILHPMHGQRHLALSLSVLYDAQHNFQGVLAVARDVTAAVRTRRRLKRVRNWLFLSLGLLVLLGAAVLVLSPYFLQTQRAVSQQRIDFRNLLAKDYVLLKSLLAQPLAKGDRAQTSRQMKSFFEMQDASVVPYRGLVLLNADKRVFDAHWVAKVRDAKKMVGSTYEHIRFAGDEDSLHKVLVVYRQVPGGSARSVELAFELPDKGRLLGWLVFVMDPKLLKEKYGVDLQDLKILHFKRP